MRRRVNSCNFGFEAMAEDTSPPTPNPGGSSDSKFSFKITIDLQDELHAFVRYSRLGLFKEAEELYLEISEGNETCFAIIAERADSLLAQGRYRDLSSFLGDKIKQPEKYRFEEDQINTLCLLQCVANIHTEGKLREALDEASWRAGATSIRPGKLSALEVSFLSVVVALKSNKYANVFFTDS